MQVQLIDRRSLIAEAAKSIMAESRDTSRCPQFINRMERYDTDTLLLLFKHFPKGKGLGLFLENGDVSLYQEYHLREMLILGKHLKRDADKSVEFSQARIVLNEVRYAFGISDLTQAPNEETGEAIIAALKIAVALREHWAKVAEENGDDSFDERFLGSQMSDNLALFLTEHYESAEKVIEYMTSTNKSAYQIDIGHLAEYLNNTAPSLGSGVL